MQQPTFISIAAEEFTDHPAFQLLAKRVPCPHCRAACACVGYHDQALVYDCPNCGELVWDELPFDPLFALDWLHAATLAHYEIQCPFCAGNAPLVGGSPLTGLYFVCEDRCHHHFARTIRRF